MAKQNLILCFDLDGTLVDSKEAHMESYKLALRKNNLPVKPSQAIIAQFGKTSEDIVKVLYPNVTQRKRDQIVVDKHRFFLEQAYMLVKQIPGAEQALEQLRTKYKLALVTNCSQEEISILLKMGGIKESLFDSIIGKEDIRHPKPAPDEILKVEKELKGKADYVIGDETYDIIMGQAARVKTIAVLTGVHDIKTLGDEEPTMIVQSVAVLPDVLFGRL